ncbi:hypothetical protein EV363DRAFT_1469550 [Boletus edulis]|nr:hypothetical protein EV363DRAFT_1469550 [Boletus edulis]
MQLAATLCRLPFHGSQIPGYSINAKNRCNTEVYFATLRRSVNNGALRRSLTAQATNAILEGAVTRGTKGREQTISWSTGKTPSWDPLNSLFVNITRNPYAYLFQYSMVDRRVTRDATMHAPRAPSNRLSLSTSTKGRTASGKRHNFGLLASSPPSPLPSDPLIGLALVGPPTSVMPVPWVFSWPQDELVSEARCPHDNPVPLNDVQSEKGKEGRA